MKNEGNNLSNSIFIYLSADFLLSDYQALRLKGISTDIRQDF